MSFAVLDGSLQNHMEVSMVEIDTLDDAGCSWLRQRALVECMILSSMHDLPQTIRLYA
jgi:hypothetical protein